tara:strand:+ start:1659 stop:2465 length:807 start_codon:yes stop_codon:yes gene_type:complete
MNLTESQIQRYSRNILLPEIGGEGQKKLVDSKVLVIGAGGLGSPLLMYLAAAGVGKLGIVDNDSIELSNLQRQIIHKTNNLSQLKTESAQETISLINPNIIVDTYPVRLDYSNIMSLIRSYDIIADGTDNFETRFLINDACFFSSKTLVSGAAQRFDGQILTFPFSKKIKRPCYRCIYPELPPPDISVNCSQSGVLGSVVGSIGAMQATEILKQLLNLEKNLSGYLLVVDMLNYEFRRIRVKEDSNCKLCSDKSSIKDLSQYKLASSI